MGGVIGFASKQDCGFNRSIHNIENSPFRSKFEQDIEEMKGNMGIGAISDGDPQPLTVYSRQGDYAIATVGRINNKDEIVQELLKDRPSQFMSMSGGGINNTELVAALISTGRDIVDGIRIAQAKVEGSVTILVLTREGLYAARDKYGRTPLIIGHKDGAYCAASESFAFINIGYKYKRELGPAEIAFLTPDEDKTVGEPQEGMRICAFLWTYFGYTTSIYEGRNVEQMRNRNGELLAEQDDDLDVDYVAGVPDSGTAHALGYANRSRVPYARPLIKYTPTWPRSFMPQNQSVRDLIARMKLIPVQTEIQNKRMLFCDDSIVRGTQLKDTVIRLYERGAKAVHMRSACPPLLFGCKFLNFSRSRCELDLAARRAIAKLEERELTDEIIEGYLEFGSPKYYAMVEEIRKELNLNTLKFQKLEKLIEAIGVDPSKVCTYCWNGRDVEMSTEKFE